MPAAVRLPNHTYFDCIVCDISEGGALLEFPSRIEFSGRLRLNFEGGNQEIICDVRHVRGNRVGVQFARNITLAARPVAAPDAVSAPLPSQRPAELGFDVGRNNAASELVALRRNAAKLVAAMREPQAEPMTGSQPTPIVVEIPVAVQPSVPRDMSSLLQSVAALAAVKAVPRPLPARAYATALVIEQVKIPAETVPRNMSSLLYSVAALVAVRSVPRPLSAGAYA